MAKIRTKDVNKVINKITGAIDDLRHVSGDASEKILQGIPKNLNADDTVSAINKAVEQTKMQNAYNAAKGTVDDLSSGVSSGEKLLPATLERNYSKEAYDTVMAERKAAQLDRAQRGGGIYDRVYRDENGKLQLKKNDFAIDSSGTGQRGHKTRTTKAEYDARQAEITRKNKGRVENIDDAWEQAHKENIERDVYRRFNEEAQSRGYKNAKEAEKELNNDILDKAAEEMLGSPEYANYQRMEKKRLKKPNHWERKRNERQQKQQQMNNARNVLYGQNAGVGGTGRTGGAGTGAADGTANATGDIANAQGITDTDSSFWDGIPEWAKYGGVALAGGIAGAVIFGDDDDY